MIACCTAPAWIMYVLSLTQPEGHPSARDHLYMWSRESLGIKLKSFEMKSLKERKFLQDIGITKFIQKGSLDSFSAYKVTQKEKILISFISSFISISLMFNGKMNYTTKELGSSPQTLILHDMGLFWKAAEGDQYWNTWRFAKWAKKKMIKC